MTRPMVRFLGAAAALTLAQMLTQMVAGALLFRGEPTPPGHFILWGLLIHLLTAVFALALAGRLQVASPRRALLLFLILFGIPANYLAETFFFDIGVGRAMLLRIYAMSLLVAGVVALLADRLGRASPVAPTARTVPAWVPRLAVAALVYVVFYVTAGLAIVPFIADFYAGRAMPSLPQIVVLQVFRGLGFAAVAWLVVAFTAGARLGRALWAGATLSILGGILPLLSPNPYLPDAVRLAHLVEVGLSNFLFGLVAGWLLSAPPRVAQVPGHALPATR